MAFKEDAYLIARSKATLILIKPSAIDSGMAVFWLTRTASIATCQASAYLIAPSKATLILINPAAIGSGMALF